ncbi:interferon-induced 35 kDa protein [Austrofundulus limnaeus]|uniref:Interferon-induced 35 kDa protein n=1 Tax=Austrofundulus limnaeus TaxID=52670 RepID=A0A2I4C2L7_AUSLI|nr:PREDICTED: interferon-induced 35 kDa protein [Austrofundulus limnaeus]
MSSDEDFSFFKSEACEDTLEGVQLLIKEQKKRYKEIMQEQKEHRKCIEEAQDLTRQFKQRTEKLKQDVEEEERSYKNQIQTEKARLDSLKKDEAELMGQILKIQAEIGEEQRRNSCLKERADVFCAMPEKKFVFRGKTGDVKNWQRFDMKSQIVYPMDGGTALITFEEEDVARNILDKKSQKVDLGGECRITVEARPVHLMLPGLVEIDSEVCPRRILVSNLPKMETEALQNKLEIHFSKSKNGGGEVDTCDFLPDSGTVVIAFTQDHIAKRLTQNEFHEVRLTQTKHKVRVTPFLNGKITNFETRVSTCPRTVLLTGIPDVMEQETLQDLLEIHFQKNGSGGGEIEAFLYNPIGQNASALFGNASEDGGDQ